MNLRLELEKPTRSKETEAKWDAMMDRLEKLRTLQDDWDDNGAPAPTSELIDAAVRVVNTLRIDSYPPPKSAVPTFDGTISIQWDVPGGFWELEFLTPTEMEEARWVKGQDMASLTRHAI